MGFAYAITGGIGTVGIEEKTGQINIKDNFICNTVTNRVLNVKIVLSTQKLIMMQVYDSSGRLVEQILNQKMNAGEYQISRRLNLPNGIYFVELRTDNFKQFNKVVVLH
jgi:hypothetical protein